MRKKQLAITGILILILTSCAMPSADMTRVSETAEITTEVDTAGESEAAETTAEDEVIHFLDPVIEAETRRILDKPVGDITKAEVLDITDFGVNREYDDYSMVGKFGSVSEKITTLGDLQWFQNLEVLVLSDCGLEKLKYLTHINLGSNPVPEEDLEEYYEPKEKDYFPVTFCEKIREDMPEFEFELKVRFDRRMILKYSTG